MFTFIKYILSLVKFIIYAEYRLYLTHYFTNSVTERSRNSFHSFSFFGEGRARPQAESQWGWHVLEDTPARFVCHLFICTGLSNGVEKGGRSRP